MSEFLTKRSNQGLNVHLSSIIHPYSLSLCVRFLSIYYSFSFYSPLLARADSIRASERERGRLGENSVAGHYIGLDARKSFSVHHQALCLPPLSSFPHSVFTILPESCSTAPNHSLCDLAPVCVSVSVLCMVCAYVCVSCCWPQLRQAAR